MIPHLLQLSSVITINKKVISELEALFINFVWSNRKHLVTKGTLILPSELGGMKMPSVKYTIETAKIMWIKRLCNTIPAKWKILSAALMGMTVKDILSQQLFISVRHKIKTRFYTNLLLTWFEFQRINSQDINDFMDQNLFNNPAIVIGNSTIASESLDWQSSGFELVVDILNEGDITFKSKLQLETEYKIKMSDMKYNQLVSVISSRLKKLSKSKSNNETAYNKNLPKECIANFSKISSAQVYKYYIYSTFVMPVSQNKWVEFYPFLEGVDWKNIYLLPSKTVIDTYLVTLQFKILHRVYACQCPRPEYDNNMNNTTVGNKISLFYVSL